MKQYNVIINYCNLFVCRTYYEYTRIIQNQEWSLYRFVGSVTLREGGSLKTCQQKLRHKGVIFLIKHFLVRSVVLLVGMYYVRSCVTGTIFSTPLHIIRPLRYPCTEKMSTLFITRSYLIFYYNKKNNIDNAISDSTFKIT